MANTAVLKRANIQVAARITNYALVLVSFLAMTGNTATMAQAASVDALSVSRPSLGRALALNETYSPPDLTLLGLGNQTNQTNHTVAPSVAPSSHTTPAPSSNTTTAPTTLAPTTAKPTPTPAPTKAYHAPTDPPTSLAPTAENHEKGEGFSFFRIVGKMFAWCILMGLGILLYGFCIQHKYQIAYYLRHCWHCLQSVNAWLIHKIRPEASHNLHRGYAAMYAQERNDAQSSLLFDAPNGTMFEGPDNNDGFVMGQQSNMNFQNMG